MCYLLPLLVLLITYSIVVLHNPISNPNLSLLYVKDHLYYGRTATLNARFWVWVHLLVNLVAMAFLFTMNLYLPWVLNFNLSQARLLKETACNYVFSVLVHGIPSISAWISIHQNSQKLFCAKTSIGH